MGGCRVFVQLSQRSQSLLLEARWVSTAPASGALSGQCVSSGVQHSSPPSLRHLVLLASQLGRLERAARSSFPAGQSGAPPDGESSASDTSSSPLLKQ